MSVPTSPPFDGTTYDDKRDNSRLASQLSDVKRAMWSGNWMTLEEIAAITNHPEASVSARLRDLRKPKFGSHTVLREYVSRGLFRYKLLLNNPLNPLTTAI